MVIPDVEGSQVNVSLEDAEEQMTQNTNMINKEELKENESLNSEIKNLIYNWKFPINKKAGSVSRLSCFYL